MIRITLLDEKKFSVLKKFGAREWPSADREHFGDHAPSFIKQRFALVARDKKRIVGHITLILDAGVLRIESILIAEKCRGRGIGTKLILSAEKKGRSMGAHRAWLETGVDWKARNFYKKLGYRVRAHLPDFYGRKDFVLMDKAL